MTIYQIYKIIFKCEEQLSLSLTKDGTSAFDNAQNILEDMLNGDNPLPITKAMKDGSNVKLENYVEAKRDFVTSLVVCNDKRVRYREKMEEQRLEFHPGCRVIIDNRPGVAQIAIERSESFDNNTDGLQLKIRDALNKLFSPYHLIVEILAKKREAEFWDAVEEQNIKMGDPITKVVYEFPDTTTAGPIDASRDSLEELYVMQKFLKAMNAPKGMYTACSEGNKYLHMDRSRKDLTHMVSLCCNNGYNISVHFKHYGIYSYGNDIKALSVMEDDVIDDFVKGQIVICGAEKGEWALVRWLDEIRKVTENYKEDETTVKRRKRRYRTGDEEESNIHHASEPLQEV